MATTSLNESLPRGAVRAGLAIAILLLVAAAAAFLYATERARDVRRAAATRVTISARACEPGEITVAAGRHAFEIVNASERAVEWEILDGVMVIEERENIAPGFSQTLTARLEPGDYAITCGLLSNPRGKLHVLAATGAATQEKPDLAAFIGALAEYKVFLASQARDFTQAADALAGAVKAGDLDKARTLYLPAQAAYARLAPVAPLFSDLDTSIDAPAAYFEKREADPAFVGLHRIAHGLFNPAGADGLAPVADRLTSDAATLQTRIHDLRVTPQGMIGGGAAALDRLTAGDPGQAGDPSELEARLSGVRKVYDLLRPIAAKTQAELASTIDGDFNRLDKTISNQASAGAADAGMSKDAAALAADLSRLRDGMELN